MSKISKKVRRLAADLCSVGASEVDRQKGVVFLTELWWMLDGEKLDLFHRDQVMFVAAMAFRNAEVDFDVLGSELWRQWELQYAEAAAMLLEGWSPPDE